MKGKNILLTFFIVFTCHCNGQDFQLLKKYIFEQFDPLASFEINYTISDFNKQIIKKKKTDEASLKKVKELEDSFTNTNNISYLTRIGCIYNKLNRKTIGSKYLNQALNKYIEKLNKSPNDQETLSDIYSLYFVIGDIPNVLEFNNRLIQVNPNSVETKSIRAFLLILNGEQEKSKQYSDSLLKIYPDLTELYLYKTISTLFNEIKELQNSSTLSNAEFKFKEFKSDFSYLDKIDYKSDNIEIKTLILALKLFVFEYKKLIPAFFSPNQSINNFKFELSSKDSNELVEFENKFLALLNNREFENTYTLYYSLGHIYSLFNKSKIAIEYFKKAIKSKPLEYRDNQDNVSSCYVNIIANFRVMKDSISAEEWTKKMIVEKASADPVAKYYIELARYRFVQRDFKKGTELLYKAIEIDSNANESYVELANIYMLNDDAKKAEEYLNICFKINPDYPPLYNSYILQMLMLNDKETAKYLLNKLLNFNPRNNFAIDVKRDFKID